MASYKATQIRWPESEVEFEKNVGFLFREILGDPNVKRAGRRGQKQKGLDLIGFRDCDPEHLVGIQCKLKGAGRKLTESEVKTEVTSALKYKPRLREYIIVTTAPDDIKIQQLVQSLSQKQLAKGRSIHIDVWGDKTLQERINEHEAAKTAFDPGFSPALQAQQVVLKQISRQQQAFATRAQVQEIADQLKDQSASAIENLRLPPTFADRELTVELSRILRRRGFREANAAEELARLSARATEGDLALGSKPLRAEILERTARSHANSASRKAAIRFYQESIRLAPPRDPALFEALDADAQGKSDQALRTLRKQRTPDSRSAVFNLLLRTKGDQEALSWVKRDGLKPQDFTPVGLYNVLVKHAELEKYDEALTTADGLSQQYLTQCPAIYLLRARLIIASILPADQKAVVFQGLPLTPRLLQLASDARSRSRIADARRDIESVLALVDELGLVRIPEFLVEFNLWLQLEDGATSESARLTIARDLADPATTLRRIRLALDYDIPFNADALSRHLRSQREVGGWSDDERFAAFLLAFHGNNPTKTAAFFDEFRDDLFSQELLALGTLAGIEVHSLAAARRSDDARKRLSEHRGIRLSDEESDRLAGVIDSIEKGDEAERIKRQYQSSNDPTSLRLLVGELYRTKDQRQLAIYAPKLVRFNRRVEDFALAINALYHERKYDELIVLAEELPELCDLDLHFLALKGWSLFHLGHLVDARKIARDLLAKRHDASDRELAINTSIESGDWGYLQSVVAGEVERVEELDGPALMRLAKIALEAGSPYVDKFRDAALAAAPDDAGVNLAAYTLSVERGEEYQNSRAHEWFQRATVLSGPEGPVQQLKLKEVINRSAGWNRQVETVFDMLKSCTTPLYLAARALRRQPIDFLMGQAIRNEERTDPRAHYPILAFSGAHIGVTFNAVRSIAIDITAIFTLELLGLLEKTLNAFDQVIIAPSTLSSLFVDRQFLRFHQPSELAKAKRIKRLIDSGALKIFPERTDVPRPLSLEVGSDLATMLTKAKESGAVVLRVAPIHKVYTFLEENADVSGYADVIADTRSALAHLRGKMEAAKQNNAAAYLARVDMGWPASAKISADSTLYLDDLSVTYLDHVSILEAMAQSVSAVYVPAEVKAHCEAIIQGAANSSDLIGTVERIRATLNSAIEQGKVGFTAHRKVKAQEEELDARGSFPTVDIMSSLSGIDMVICDDRFLNKDRVWTDSTRVVPVATTADLLIALNDRTVLSEEEMRGAFTKLRKAGYYSVPLQVDELLAQLDRAGLSNGELSETPELTALRESISLGVRAGVFRNDEERWLFAVRFACVRAIRTLWSDYPISDATIAKADWLVAVLPNPMAWYSEPHNAHVWNVAIQQTVGQATLLLGFYHSDESRRRRYGEWIERRLIGPMRESQPWLWRQILQSFKYHLVRTLERQDAA